MRFDFIETVGDEDRTRAPTPFSGHASNDYRVTTGSLGATYALTRELTLAANASRGFRAPTLFEQFADGVHGGVAAVQRGNPDLDPERSLNTDLGLRWRSPRVKASATVYRNRINDFIFLQDTGTSAPNGLPIFVNRQADATLKGIELQGSVKVTETVELSASLDLVDGENERTGEELPLLPADAFRVEGTWSPRGLALNNPYLRVGMRYNASKEAAPGEPFAQFDDAPFGTASTDSYMVYDLGAGFELPGPGSRPARMDLEVRNLADESYRDFLDTYKGYALSPGRNVRLQVRVPL